MLQWFAFTAVGLNRSRIALRRFESRGYHSVATRWELKEKAEKGQCMSDMANRCEARGLRGGMGVLLVAAACLAGCATGVGTTASSFLNRVRESPDPNLRHQAYARLADPNCYDNEEQQIEAARELSQRLDKKSEPLVTRAVICRTLGELGRPEARDALGRACDDPEPIIRAAACRALGRIGSPDDALLLARVMSADSNSDCRIAAIEGLGTLKAKDPRIALVLVDGMENPDPAVRLASYQSLQRITGKDLGPEVAAWRASIQPVAEATNAAQSVDPAAVPVSVEAEAPPVAR